MLRVQVFPVHLVSQEDSRLQSLVDRHAATIAKGNILTLIQSVIRAVQDNLDRPGFDARFHQQCRKADTRPFAV